MNDIPVDYRQHYGNVWDEGFPLTPLEAWYVMRGFAVRPKAALDRETFARLPGDLERADGYVMLRQR